MRVTGRVLQRLLFALYRQRLALVVVVLLVGVAAGYEVWLSRTNLVNEAAASGILPVEMVVQDLQPPLNSATLTLKEKNGTRRISMAVGATEALAIAISQAKSGVTVPQDQQPKAYDLVRLTVQELGGRIDRVVVNKATQNQYLAQVIVSSNGEAKVVPARPGDAVALALSSKAPIYVEDDVLDKYGTKGNG